MSSHPTAGKAVISADGREELPWKVVQMARIRIIFEKKGWITFLNHQDLPVLFSRAARRAGLSQEFTQGFSPHPRISLGPALAAGVEGLQEPADFWFNEWDDTSLVRWNDKLPEGISILKYAETEGVLLSKLTEAALYRISGVNFELDSEALNALKKEVERTGTLYEAFIDKGSAVLILGGLENCGAGNLVRSLKEEGICEGWKDLYLVRESVGTWDSVSGTIVPLV